MSTNVTVWNECRHEKEDEAVQRVYPESIGGAIVDGLQPYGFRLTSIVVPQWQRGDLLRPIELYFNDALDFSTVNLNTIQIRKLDGTPAVGELLRLQETVVGFRLIGVTEKASRRQQGLGRAEIGRVVR